MGFLDKRFKLRKKEQNENNLFFSIPFVFDKSFIAFISELNNKDTKYKIRRVYNSLSVTAVGKSGFEHGKAVPPNSSAVEIVSDLKPYVEALKKENIEFVYTMNSVATVPKIEFQKRLPRTHRFLQELQESGVKYITIGNQMLSEYIKSVFPEFIVGASTMMDVTSVTKAVYLAEHLNIKYVIPSTDLNKDFDFIESFKTLLPNVELELMADEGCIYACPTKNIHYPLFAAEFQSDKCIEPIKKFPNYICGEITKEDPALQLIKNRIIYPWELETFEQHGVNGIKLVGRDHPSEQLKEKIKVYMLGAGDSELALNAEYGVYNSRYNGQADFKYGNIKMKYLKPYLPELKNFTERRPNCRSLCGAKCFYCYNLAQKLRDRLKGDDGHQLYDNLEKGVV